MKLEKTDTAVSTLGLTDRGGAVDCEHIERKLAAILAADVVGYSRLMGTDEAGTLRHLKASRSELIDPSIKRHKGRIVKTTGDGILVEFPSVVEAVTCAVEVQRAMIDRNVDVPEDRLIEFRVGINLGDVIVEADGDLYGDGVNVAARLEQLVEPGGICISRAVRDDIRDKLSYPFEDAGEQIVKNIARPLRVFTLWEETIAALPRAEQKPGAVSGPRRLTARPFARALSLAEIGAVAALAAALWFGLARPMLSAA